jgi:hypothetical protein
MAKSINMMQIQLKQKTVDDIEKGWNSERVQLACISFCEKYARNVSRPSKVLKQLLS